VATKHPPVRIDPLATGFLLWVFAHLIPLLHLELLSEISTMERGLALLPLAVVLLATRLNAPIAHLIALPVSLLPLLLLRPELMGTQVYGALAFAALGIASVTHILVALRPSRIEKEDPIALTSQGIVTDSRLLSLHAINLTFLGLAMATLVHFHPKTTEMIAATHGGYAERATTFIGLFFFLVWLRLMVGTLPKHLGMAMVDRNRLITNWYRYEAKQRNTANTQVAFRRGIFLLLLSVAALSATLVF
jgi:hypothetical protein